MKKEYIYGVDIGSYYLVVSRTKYTDSDVNFQVLSNSLDRRLTRTCISFTKGKLNPVGKTLTAKDLPNTIVNGKDFFVDKFDYEEGKMNYYPFNLQLNSYNQPCFKVNYIEDNREYNLKGIYLSYFHIIEQIIENKANEEEKSMIQNWILAYPPYYSKEQQNKLRILCNFELNGNNVLCEEVISESLAYSLSFGYENNSKFEKNSSIVFLVDIGYQCATITCTKYEKDKCIILGSVYDQSICGRKIDGMLLEYVRHKVEKDETFKENIDKIKNDRCCDFRLLSSIISVKEKLSADGASCINLTVSDLYNCEDFECNFSKDELNEILKSAKYEEMLNSLLNKCIENSKIKPEEVSEIVIAGGTCRIPYIQSILKDYLNKRMKKKCDLTKSINMDEHISNGCNYYGMILDDRWNYRVEIQNKEISNDLLILKDKDSKHMTIRIRENLGKTIHTLFTPNNEKMLRQTIITEIENECKLVVDEIRDCEKCDTYNFILKNIEFSTDTSKADKLRNDIEQRIYEYQRDLNLITDKQYVEIQQKYLKDVITTLHNDLELKIYNKAHEYEKEFNHNWLKRKTDLKEESTIYIDIFISNNPKSNGKYNTIKQKIKAINEEEMKLSECFNICNEVLSNKKVLLEKMKNELIKCVNPMRKHQKIVKEMHLTLYDRIEEALKIVKIDNIPLESLKRLNKLYELYVKNIYAKFSTRILILKKDINKDYEECIKVKFQKLDLKELKSLIDNLNILSESPKDYDKRLEELLENFQKLYEEYNNRIKEYRKKIFTFRSRMTNEINILNPKPPYLEDVIKKTEEIEFPEENSKQTNNGDNDDDDDSKEESKYILFMLAKGNEKMRRYYTDGLNKFKLEFEEKKKELIQEVIDNQSIFSLPGLLDEIGKITLEGCNGITKTRQQMILLEEKRKVYEGVIRNKLSEIIKYLKEIPSLKCQFIKPIEKNKLDEYEKQLKESIKKDVISDIVLQKNGIENELEALSEEIENSNVTDKNDRNILNEFKKNENRFSQISDICNLHSKYHKIRVEKLVKEIGNLKDVTDSEEDAIELLKETKTKEEDYNNIRLKEINDLIKNVIKIKNSIIEEVRNKLCKCTKLDEIISLNGSVFKEYRISTTKFNLYYKSLDRKEEVVSRMKYLIIPIDKEYNVILAKIKNVIKEQFPDANIDGLKDEEVTDKFIELDINKNLPVVKENNEESKPETDINTESTVLNPKPTPSATSQPEKSTSVKQNPTIQSNQVGDTKSPTSESKTKPSNTQSSTTSKPSQ